MIDRGELFLDQDLSGENSRREIEKTKERLQKLEIENKALREKLNSFEENKKSRVIKTTSLIIILGSFLMFSTNMTGYFISTKTNNTTNFISLILFGLGLLGIYISRKV